MMSNRYPIRKKEEIIEDMIRAGESCGLAVSSDFLQAAMAIIHDRKNALVTGKAGTGKTTFIGKFLIPLLARYGVVFAPTATTGIAGSHFGGRTLHSWLGCQRGPDDLDPSVSYERRQFIYQSTAQQILKRMPSGVRDGVEKRIRGAELVIVDEVSMCSGNFLNFVDVYLRRIRDPDTPFGGLQLVFVGDFLQLPPVDKSNRSTPDWAFMSESWRDGQVYPFYFEQVFRQVDQEFAGFLNSVRDGIQPSPETEVYMRRFIRDDLTAEGLSKLTVLVSTNEEADRISDQSILFYPEPEVTLSAEFTIVPEHRVASVDDTRAALLRARLVREHIRARVGMPMLMTVNDPEGRFVNGTRVVLAGWVSNDVTGRVESLRLILPSGEEILMGRRKHCARADQDPQFTMVVGNEEVSRYPTMSQFPVIQAFAITAHKGQGMSLDACAVDMRRTFAAGQVYVALSRLRTPEGLTLLSPAMNVFADPTAAEYYRVIQLYKEQQQQQHGQT